MFKSCKNSILGLMVIVFLLTGCKSPLTGTGPYDPTKANEVAGQRYYVGKDIILVSATITEKTVPTITDDLTIVPQIYTNSVVSITKKVVPDYKQYYMINLNAGALYDDTITIETSSDGLLTNLDSDVTGKTGEVIKNIGTIATNVLAIAAPVLFRQELGQDCIDNAIKLGLNKEHQLFAKLDKHGCKILERLNELHEESDGLYSTIFEIRKKMAAITDAEQIAKIKKALDVQAARLDAVTAKISAKNTVYENLFAIFKESKLKEKITTDTFNEIFEIAEIPVETVIKPLIFEKDQGIVITKLTNNNFKKMAALFEKTKALFTIKSLTPADLKKPKMKYFSDAPPMFPTDKDMPKNRIHFRQTFPFYISKYHIKDSLNNTLSHYKSEIISLMHPDSSVQFVEYNTSKFTRRKLILTFNTNTNVLTKIETINTSSASAVTGDLATAISAMPKGYADALKQIGLAQKELNTIAVFDYTQKIEELTKKKALIDAQVAFEGAQVTKSLLIEKEVLDQQLAKLASELAFKTAEASFDQQLGLSKISADLTQLSKQLEYAKKELTYENQLEAEKLKSEIQSLKNDLETLKDN